ncbi:SRPBCC family protein [Flexivirga meconopsidis]|uniref:SRPBCC family protein n=1 Tax=Flexivirga meconopsidis TaxID=2977121 RepID=UPI00224032C2|nr:SRPBCC family protein [Flexivirga meconopsidis]
MTARHFRFASTHRVGAARDDVFAILAEGETWDRWWPQIRSITAYDETRGSVHIRSVLPLTLRLELTSEVADPESGVLRASLAGDLVGWSQFVLTSDGPAATSLAYTQEVDLMVGGVLGRVSTWRAMRPLLIANHAAMMRSGMRGLERAASHPKG